MRADNYQRINITLPSETLRQLDATAKTGDRSRLIDEAVNFYLSQQKRKQLEEAIKEGAIKWRKRDREIAEEMSNADDPWPEY